MIKKVCALTALLAGSACTFSNPVAETMPFEEYMTPVADVSSLLYPNDGVAVLMNGRDYDAFTLAYCVVVHGEQHTRTAQCIMDVRREFPARKLGYATETVEPRGSDLPG